MIQVTYLDELMLVVDVKVDKPWTGDLGPSVKFRFLDVLRKNGFKVSVRSASEVQKTVDVYEDGERPLPLERWEDPIL